MKALILCAGEGKRLMPLTEKTPKPMVLINGKPLLEYNIKLLKFYGIKDIAINTSHLPEKIKEYFGDGEKWGVKITYSYEPNLLGTAGALNNFRDFFGKDDFFVIAADNLTDIHLKKNFAEATKFENRSIYLFNNKILNYIPSHGFSDFGNEIFPKLIKNNEKIFCFDMGDCYFRGIENINLYQEAKKEIETGERKLNFYNKLSNPISLG
ncbi:MAG: nucleotidyltransferase family protein [Candidatus Pacearchaeota archaeon]|nr:nucleotidyltransferase family protein [Candidatus Pacearchaeota archaeon]